MAITRNIVDGSRRPLAQMTSSTFPLTTVCSGGPEEGVALFPPDVLVPDGVRVRLKAANGKSKTLRGKSRNDRGAEAICVEQAVFADLGGKGEQVEVDGLAMWKALWFDSTLRLALTIAALTFAIAVMTAYLGYVKDTGDKSPDVVVKVAPWIFAAALLLALLKLRQEIKKA